MKSTIENQKNLAENHVFLLYVGMDNIMYLLINS